MEPEVAVDWNGEAETNYEADKAGKNNILENRDDFAPANENI